MYVFELPENIQELLVKMFKKQMVHLHGEQGAEIGPEMMLNSKVSDIDGLLNEIDYLNYK